jgi:hypothetical protein
MTDAKTPKNPATSSIEADDLVEDLDLTGEPGADGVQGGYMPGGNFGHT